MAMYEQGVQEIRVIVTTEGGLGGSGGGGSVKGAKEGSSSEGIAQNDRPNAQTLRRRRIILTNATHTLAAARQISRLTVNHVVGGIGSKTGDQSLQDQVRRDIEVFDDVSGFASSVSMGMIYGAWGGPIGIAVGGTLAAATTGMSTAVKYKGREREYTYKMFKENNSIEYNRSRANINMTTGRLR